MTAQSTASMSTAQSLMSGSEDRVTGPLPSSPLPFVFVLPTREKCQRTLSRRFLIAVAMVAASTFPFPSNNFLWLTRNPDLGTRPYIAEPVFLFFFVVLASVGVVSSVKTASSGVTDEAPAGFPDGVRDESVRATAPTASTRMLAARRRRRLAGEEGGATTPRGLRRGEPTMAFFVDRVVALPADVRAAFNGRPGDLGSTDPIRPLALS